MEKTIYTPTQINGIKALFVVALLIFLSGLAMISKASEYACLDPRILGASETNGVSLLTATGTNSPIIPESVTFQMTKGLITSARAVFQKSVFLGEQKEALSNVLSPLEAKKFVLSITSDPDVNGKIVMLLKSIDNKFLGTSRTNNARVPASEL